jgi:arylsulfatase A-like enzyme
MRVSGDADVTPQAPSQGVGACGAASLRLGHSFLPLPLLLVLVVGCTPEPPLPPRPAHPSLLLITIDTLRADHLGCYGYERETSPRLDELARGSVLFENAIAQSAVTPVSHASILTGLNPYRHGLRSLHGGRNFALPDDRATLAEILLENGYATGGFVSAFPASRHFGLHQGFQHWDEAFGSEERAGTITDAGFVETRLAQRRAGETTERALDWLESQGRGPFFAWVHYFDVHDTELPTPGLYATLFPPASDSDEDELISLYDGELAYVDTQVGRLLQFLDAQGLGEETVVAVLADHGQGLGDHGWWGHSVLFQEQVRVPFVLSVPFEPWRGRVDALVRTIDLVPTLVDALGAECPEPGCDFDGVSLRSILEGGPDEARIAYSESINDLAAYENSPNRDDSLYALNDGRYKLIAFYRGTTPGPSMLFDLKRDPAELRNLAEDRAGEGARLRSLLDERDALVEDTSTVPLDPEAHRRLKALGYVQ